MVVLGLEADDSCEEKCKSCDKRAVKLGLEWNSNFERSWKFFDTLIGNLEISEFWTISDWTGLERTEFGLVRPSLISFDVSCHEFCTGFFHFCYMTCLWVLCAETTVICLAVM